MIRKTIGFLCIFAAAVIFVIAAIKFYPKFMDYKKGQDLYNDLSDKYTVHPGKEDDYEIEDGRTSLFERLFVKDSGDSLENESEDESESLEKELKTRKSLEIQKEKIADIFEELGIDENPEDYLCIDVDSEGLLKENSDYIGWIYIPKTGISYPVVQTDDNSSYLHTNFHKEYNYPGTIFMDYRCKKGILNHHGILYGHNMRDGSMFAQTKQYVNQEFADEHPVIWFITPKYKLLYRVFSSFVASPLDDDAFGIEGYDFKDNMEWDEVIKSLKEKSAIKVDHDVNGRDFTLTLSTCTNERVTRVCTTAVMLGAIEE